MSKPNTEFNLGLRDIDLIEDAINSVIARRSSTMSLLAEDTAENTTDICAVSYTHLTLPTTPYV